MSQLLSHARLSHVVIATAIFWVIVATVVTVALK
jgi:hypothetical protein